jgi:hypothetical protein
MFKIKCHINGRPRYSSHETIENAHIEVAGLIASGERNIDFKVTGLHITEERTVETFPDPQFQSMRLISSD